MVNKRIHWMAGGLALAFLALAVGSVIAAVQIPERQVQAQVGGTDSPPAERQRDVVPDAPAISFIDNPDPTCYRVEQGTDACTIAWNYMYVDAGASSYVISMTVNIDGKMRSNAQGFFQSWMYIPYELTSPGFRVDCGIPGSGGNPALGKAHSYIIRAKASDGLKSANYGTVYCPADMVSIARLNLNGPETGHINHEYSFGASLVPITTTLPVTYTWQATDLSPQTFVGGLSSPLNLTWDTPGIKTVMVEAQNLAGTVSASILVAITPYTLYLPITRR